MRLLCTLRGTTRSHPHNSLFLLKKILFQLVCTGLRGAIESIPVTVLCSTSTQRRDCSTQQAVRSTADVSKIDLIDQNESPASKDRSQHHQDSQLKKGGISKIISQSLLNDLRRLTIHSAPLFESVMSVVWSRQQVVQRTFGTTELLITCHK